MQFADELLPGTWLVRLRRLDDARGSFVKTYARSVFESVPGLPAFDFLEEFYSYSHRDVVRGMHFQLPPHDHMKLVYCAHGSAQDVLLDLRRGPGYGRVATANLDAAEPSLVLVPRGVAHGFRALEDHTLMIYKTSTEHAPQYDAGVHWASFGFDWACNSPVMSARDAGHPAFNEFNSPF